MYQFYSILKDRDEIPSPDEINIVSAKRQLDWKTEAEYLQRLEKTSENIKRAFQNQQAQAIVSETPSAFLLFVTYDLQQGPWDQGKFEQVLMEWVITCDQLFEEVERPKFIMMMNHTHHTGTSLKIPKHNSIKLHLMKMGDDTIEDVRNMFTVRYYICSLLTMLTLG